MSAPGRTGPKRTEGDSEGTGPLDAQEDRGLSLKRVPLRVPFVSVGDGSGSESCTARSVSEEVAAMAARARPEDLPALIGALEAAKAIALTRLADGTRPRPAGASEDECCLVPLPEVARILGIPEDRAYDLAREGKLPVVTIGKYKRVRKSALRAFVAQNETAPAGFRPRGAR